MSSKASAAQTGSLIWASDHLSQEAMGQSGVAGRGRTTADRIRISQKHNYEAMPAVVNNIFRLGCTGSGSQAFRRGGGQAKPSNPEEPVGRGDGNQAHKCT
ncbi:hypothetical protein DPEC_G00251730 [Dallia pectoralis]|uniref:Uncharacterized protein n=1 Tax=Dallia pectoralis TaxID=75939 RepID=A0ACC2FTU8_DALPE|nr:hypothetical protein DPEC_G00251730 [Dallia pectoralis]